MQMQSPKGQIREEESIFIGLFGFAVFVVVVGLFSWGVCCGLLPTLEKNS